jgi:beta-galactosidase
MTRSVASGSPRGGLFLRVVVALGLCGAFGWFQACGADVKQANSGSGAGGATGGMNPTTGDMSTGSVTGTGTGTDTTVGGNPGAGGSDSTTGMGPTGGGGDGMGGSGMGGSAGGPPMVMSSRVDANIDAGWKFSKPAPGATDIAGAETLMFNDAAWMSLDLPHTWNNVDGANGPTTTPAYYRGIAWYRKHYTPPATMMGKQLYLQFDASAYITDVWVNGTKVGTHAGGYAGFRFDVTATLKVGMDNLIAVKVDNSQAVTNTFVVVPGASTANLPPRSGDFTFYGGIYRDVHVLATDPLAISPMDFGSSGVYLKPTNVTAASADLSVTVKLLNASTAAKMASVEVTLLDAANMPVQMLTGTQSVPATGGADLVITGKVMTPHLWNGLADPYVYHANVVVKDGTTITDAVQQPLGFRFFAFNANTGFSLNGQPYPLHGVCMHQDHSGKGNVFSPRDIDNDFALLKEMGVTNVRFAHYQHPQYTYDKADQAGIVSWAEDPVVDSINDTPEFLGFAKQQLQELIRQSYNHPSIFIWAISNEILLRPSTPANANILGLVTTLNGVAHMEDSTRLTINSCANNLQDDPVNFIADLNAFNRYSGWYYGRMGDFAAWADMKHAMYPTKLVVVAEYGAGSSVGVHGLPIVETGTDRTMAPQSEEYQTVFHESHWSQIKTRPFLVWTSVWNMFDFAADYRNEGLIMGPGATIGLNTKGLVTYDRQTKKDAFFWYKANWSKEPFVHINYSRFTAMPKSATEIRVYSNQPSVDLTLNGTSLGAKQAADHLFIWTGVTWAAGANVVKATAGTNTDTVTWTN